MDRRRKVELFEEIRREYRFGVGTIQGVAKKLKTHRGARKRFKITGTGKIKRMHSGKRHLLGTKKPGRMRKLKKLTLVSEADVRTLRQMLPYG